MMNNHSLTIESEVLRELTPDEVSVVAGGTITTGPTPEPTGPTTMVPPPLPPQGSSMACNTMNLPDGGPEPINPDDDDAETIDENR